MNKLNNYTLLTGRILIATMFVISGFDKISGYEGTAGWMQSMGVTGMLLPLVIALEIGGGLAIIVGWQTRIAALALAGFCILTALIFHSNLADQMQYFLFMKNFALAGGFLFLVANGPGTIALDARKKA